MLQTVDFRFDSGETAAHEVEWLPDSCFCYTAEGTRRFAIQLGLKPVTTLMENPQSNGMAESGVTSFKRDNVKLANRLTWNLSCRT